MSNSIVPRFILHFIIYLLVIAGLAAYPIYKYADEVTIEGILANLALFFFVTIISFWFIVFMSKKTNGSILNAFLGSTGIKMLLSLVYFIVLLDSFPGREIEFAVTFFAIYLVCTVFEVYYLLSNLRQI